MREIDDLGTGVDCLLDAGCARTLGEVTRTGVFREIGVMEARGFFDGEIGDVVAAREGTGWFLRGEKTDGAISRDREIVVSALRFPNGSDHGAVTLCGDVLQGKIAFRLDRGWGFTFAGPRGGAIENGDDGIAALKDERGHGTLNIEMANGHERTPDAVDCDLVLVAKSDVFVGHRAIHASLRETAIEADDCHVLEQTGTRPDAGLDQAGDSLAITAAYRNILHGATV